MIIVPLHSYNDYVVETVTKWLCFYVCERERGREKGTEREHYMDEYLREPEREREMVLSHFWLQVCLLE